MTRGNMTHTSSNIKPIISVEEMDLLKKREDHLRYFAESMAEYDCSYGDDCPDFAGTRHGTCHACKARKVLKECEKLAKY